MSGVDLSKQGNWFNSDCYKQFDRISILQKFGYKSQNLNNEYFAWLYSSHKMVQKSGVKVKATPHL